MSLGDFLKSRFSVIFSNSIALITLLVFLFSVGNTLDTLKIISIIWIIVLGAYLFFQYKNRKAFFSELNRPMANNNTRQAYFPDGALILGNRRGTAPGCIIEENGKTVVMLPGPPSEMIPMFDEDVLPYLAKKTDYVIVSRYIRLFGIGESSLEEMLMDLIERQENRTIATYAKEGEVTIRVTAKCTKNQEAASLLHPVFDEIVKRLGDNIYSIENKELHVSTAEMLISKGFTISIAESCTGGLITTKLTEIPGISKVFDRSAVTYSDQSKIEQLGVKKDTLEKFGAVSAETAKEMAIGIKKAAGTEIGLSVTGIAGPDGGTDEKPVGLVYIAIADNTGIDVKELRLWGSRERIRNMTSLHAFDLIRRRINKINVD